MRNSGLIILGIAVVLGGIFAWVEFSGGPVREAGPGRLPRISPESAPASAQPRVTRTPEPMTLSSPSSPKSVTAPSSEEQGLIAAMNGERASRGVAVLTPDATLNELARAHAQDMVTKNYFSHTSPDGTTFQMRIAATGYGYAAAAENIGLASSWTSIVPNWMASEGHRSNILSAEHTLVGTGTARGTYQGHQVVYAVAVFAARQ